MSKPRKTRKDVAAVSSLKRRLDGRRAARQLLRALETGRASPAMSELLAKVAKAIEETDDQSRDRG